MHLAPGWLAAVGCQLAGSGEWDCEYIASLQRPDHTTMVTDDSGWRQQERHDRCFSIIARYQGADDGHLTMRAARWVTCGYLSVCAHWQSAASGPPAERRASPVFRRLRLSIHGHWQPAWGCVRLIPVGCAPPGVVGRCRAIGLGAGAEAPAASVVQSHTATGARMRRWKGGIAYRPI